MFPGTLDQDELRQMHDAAYQLMPRISYRGLGDVAIIVDHASGSILTVNREALGLLERLDRGGAMSFDADELSFLESLASEGIVHRAGMGHAPASWDQDNPEKTEGRDDLIDELGRSAERLMVPLHCQIELTCRCGMDCRHCYLGEPRLRPREELATAEITRFLDALADLGGLFLLLTGGEPFFRKDLKEIFDHARDCRFAVSLLTSGVGVERGLAAHMADRGLDNVQISIYGADAETHDGLTRVPGSFDAALESIDLFSDLGVRVQAGVTVTAANASGMERIADLLGERNVPISLSTYIEPGRDGSTAPQALTVGPEDLERVLRVFPPGTARLGRRELDDPPCGAGASVVALDPSGTVYPCHAMRLPVGSILHQSLGDIWHASPVLAEFRKTRVSDLVDCPSCEHISSCNRCPGFAVAEGKSFKDHTKIDCLQAKVLHILKKEGLNS